MSAAMRLDFSDEDIDIGSGEGNDIGFGFGSDEDIDIGSGSDSESEQPTIIRNGRYFFRDHTEFSDMNYDDEHYQGCDFSNVTYTNCTFNLASFESSFDNGSSETIEDTIHTSFLNCRFVNCTFSNSAFSNVSMYDCSFVNCNIRRATFDSCKFFNTTFDNSRLMETTFIQSSFCRVNFQGTVLENINLERTNLSSVQFSVNDASGNPTGEITGRSTSFHYSILSTSLATALGNRGGSTRKAERADIERIQTTCEYLERDRDEYSDFIQSEIVNDAQELAAATEGMQTDAEIQQQQEQQDPRNALRGQARLDFIAEQSNLAAEAAAAIPHEEPPVLTGPTCFDITMQDDAEINAYLAEAPDNFVIGVKGGGNIRYECYSLTDLKRMNRLTPVPTDRLPYKVFYECKDETPVDWQGNTYGRDWLKPGGRTFIKVTFDMITYVLLKPDWIFDGPVPEPRVFIIERISDVYKFVTSEFVPNRLANASAHGADHCNQQYRQGVYRLAPVTLEADGSVPLTYTTSTSTGGRKRKTRRTKDKNKKYTKKKNNKTRRHKTRRHKTHRDKNKGLKSKRNREK